MKIFIKKLEEVENPRHPNNIGVGWSNEFTTTDNKVPEVVVGEAFWPCNWWRTSPVVEIIDEHTFKTLNSKYYWEVRK